MVILTVARTLFYQYFLLFVGISIGFIANAEWVGYKSAVISRSVSNIFFPITFTPEMEEKLKQSGATRIWLERGSPDEFQVLGDVVYANDEFYYCRFSYRDKNGELVFDDDIVRMRWKTWEYNFNNPTVLDPIDTEEEAKAEIDRLKEWQDKVRDTVRKADKKQAELMEQEKERKKKDPANVT